MYILKFYFYYRKRFGVYEKVMPVETTPSRWVPDHIDKPDYIIGKTLNTRISPEIKDNEQIQGMRNSCNVAANVLRIIQPFILVNIFKTHRQIRLRCFGDLFI